MTHPGWPSAELIETARLRLEPLRVAHALEVAPGLADDALHTYIGGRPATLEQLRTVSPGWPWATPPITPRAGMVDWLRQHGVDDFWAHIHPGHDASIGVARSRGLQATDVIVDGETRWACGQQQPPG